MTPRRASKATTPAPLSPAAVRRARLMAEFAASGARESARRGAQPRWMMTLDLAVGLPITAAWGWMILAFFGVL